MRYSTTAIVLIVFILIFSIFVANFASIVSTDKKLEDKLKEKQEFKQNVKDLVMNDSGEHLMWFIQISDLHISIFRDKDRIKQLKEFVNNTIDVIRPSVVLASGDLTDARDADHLGSNQYSEEWKIYKNILSSMNVTNRTIWLDIRGNHDAFNVPGKDSPSNFFQKYSIQGANNSRSYLKQVQVGNNKYSFIAIDACLEPGPKRPYNFIGLLDVDETSLVLDLAEESRRLESDRIVWFGHYPTSCILSPGSGNRGLRGILGQYDEGYVYLCGHLHTLGGMVKKMYTLHNSGFLELELADWKDNRMFRVAAFDHGIFSFTDIKHNDWPIVLVTNPKDSLFNVPKKENIMLQKDSTHIRILIFTPSKVKTCSIKINNKNIGSCVQSTNNLFVKEWDPELYKRGLHYLEVYVETEDNRSKKITQTFSFDGSRTNFGILGQMILMADICQYFQAIFGIGLTLCVVPLCILRIIHELVYAGRFHKPRLSSSWLRRLIKKLWVLATIDRLFYPIIFYCLYIMVGPWSIGEVVDGYTGVIFAWGIFINNSFIPGSLTYLHGFFQFIFCQFPLIFIYANCAYDRYEKLTGKSDIVKRNRIDQFVTYVPFLIIIIVEISLAIYFWKAYGFLAFILGPFRTWTVIFNVYLWYLSRNIPENCYEPAIGVLNS